MHIKRLAPFAAHLRLSTLSFSLPRARRQGIGAGTDVAVEAGDIVLVRSDPRDVPRIIDLSKASYRKMIQNLAWATGYLVRC